ncbi:MAG: hypothetical protein WCI77_02040 [Candidatus Omnitrophota bacterium]
MRQEQSLNSSLIFKKTSFCRKIFYTLLLYAFMFIVGCANVNSQETQSGSYAENPYALADSLLTKVFSVYQNYTRDGFERLVSQDFNPIRSEFIDTVEKSFYAGNILEMHCFTDKALLSSDKLSVNFKWQKKMLPYGTKEVALLTGAANFVFKHENGSWRIYQVSGDSPF